ncbi:MAG: TylF/MycF/NovP-related O-methyltransferase [Chloroflexota bacterium]
MAVQLREEQSELYLTLMKRCLTNYIYGEAEYKPIIKPRGGVSSWIVHFFRNLGIGIVCFKPFDEQLRIDGRDWPPPPFAHSMIGLKRLDNIQFCIEDILSKDIPGDLIEAGVWRGGAIIFMRAVLKVYGVKDRIVWGADSFQGLPKPDVKKNPHDKGWNFYRIEELSVSLDVVKRNFVRYDLLDDQVAFLSGWFSQTLPTAPLGRLALIRLDADMYGSTMDALTHLYPKLSNGGYVIIDDYGAVKACRLAVDDFRKNNDIKDDIISIDGFGVYWKRTR